MYKLLEGQSISNKILSNLKEEINNLNVKPGLAIILVSNDLPSKIYVNMKIKAARDIGFNVNLIKLKKNIAQEELVNSIEKLNNDPLVHGIIVQFPLPKHINPQIIRNKVFWKKDVDGLNVINQKKLLENKKTIISPTAKGVETLIKKNNIEIKNKKIIIIGNGKIAGWPISKLMEQSGGNVTVCTTKTKNISFYTKTADIIIACAGSPNIINENNIKEGSTIINVGMKNRQGDVNFDSVILKASNVSPIIGGTGPLTVAFLLKNLLECYKII